MRDLTPRRGSPVREWRRRRPAQTLGRRTLRTTIQRLPEWARYFSELYALLPAADRLPRGWALRLADGIGWAEALTPLEAGRDARREVHAATAATGARAAALAAQRLAAYRRDLVILRRLRTGREHTRDWKVTEVNAGPVHDLVARKQPVLLAGGHFMESAHLVVNTRIFPQLAGRTVSRAMPPLNSRDPAAKRERLENELVYGLSRQLIGMTDMTRHIPRVGEEGNVQDRALAQLAQPGGVVSILIDALWERPGAYRRPFAGLRERGFALGAARIARIAQVPIVLRATVFDGPMSVRVEWCDPVQPGAPDDKASDVAVIDQLLDQLERFVGRYPSQYLHPVGFERRWNAETERWEPARANAQGYPGASAASAM